MKETLTVGVKYENRFGKMKNPFWKRMRRAAVSPWAKRMRLSATATNIIVVSQSKTTLRKPRKAHELRGGCG